MVLGINYPNPHTIDFYAQAWRSYGELLDRPLEFLLASNALKDSSIVRKFGTNAAVGTAEEDIWTPGGTLTWPTSASTASISYLTPDDASSAGARSVRIWGLDTNFDPIDEIVSLPFLGSPATSSNSYRRLYRAHVHDCGTYAQAYTGAGGTNVNNINISLGGNLQIMIPAQMGQSQSSHYTIPNGYWGFLMNAAITSDVTQSSTVRMWERHDADDTTVPVRGRRLVKSSVGSSGQEDFNEHFAKVFPPKTDVWFSAVGPALTTAVEVTYVLALIKEPPS